jgi:hypothetical protein
MTKRLLNLAAGFAVLAAVGCGGGTADVSGKVSFKGKPVVFGTVVVIGPDNLPKSGAIQPDGTYRVRGVKPGTAQLAVSSPLPPGARQSTKKVRGRGIDDDERVPDDAASPVSPEVARAWFPLPVKYADPVKSGLTADVRGDEPVNLELN